MARIKFVNTFIDNITMDDAIQKIEDLIHKNKCAYIVTPNVDQIIQIEQDQELKEIFDNADLSIADGKPLIWISKWFGTPIKEKISGSDLLPVVCQMSALKGYSIFLLGAAEGVAAKAAQNLKEKYEGLRVVGNYSPPYGFEQDVEELDKIESMIKKAKPDILIVGLGTPKEERFIYDHRLSLNVPISLPLGASIDFAAGIVKRAPKWMSDHGLEWLFRIVQEPKRLFKRYLYDAVKIIPIILKYKHATDL